MSAEAPRNHNTGEPIPPQGHEGGFSKFLRGFFVVSSEMSTQLPSELSDFAAKINRGAEEGLNMAQQAELRRIEQERQSVERRLRAQEANEQQRRQLIENRLQRLEGIKQITEDIRIRDRLAYIRTTVWEGKGQIQDMTTSSASITEFNSLFENWDPRVAFALMYTYPSADREESGHGRQGYSYGYNWRLAPTTEITSLEVCIHSVDNKRYLDVISPCLIQEEEKILIDRITWGNGVYGNNDDHRVDWVHGPYTWEGYKPLNGSVVPVGVKAIIRIPIDRLSSEEIEEKLDQILINETTARVRGNTVPSKLILSGQEKLRRAKASPQWMKWEWVLTDSVTD